ncbi:MAG: homogentisate 1,2-dioxygenase, partial [Betaproteobacteria bacterium]|nr:homogentisate 1,2-dioxygenase [Betaproteobacteria bacterium]
MAHAYMGGFGNQFATEALTGALPQGRNSPCLLYTSPSPRD